MIDRHLKTKDEILGFCKEQQNKNEAELFFSFAERENLKEVFKMTAKYYSFSFFLQNSPRALFKMDLNDKDLRIKAQLFFIEGHNDDLEKLSDNLKNMIKNTPDCTRCSMQCKQGVRFMLDGESRFTCINEGHYFKDMTFKECEELISLLQSEYRFIQQMKQKQE